MTAAAGRFARLWAGQATSAFGSAISTLAIPTLAIVTLGAPISAIGLLQAVQFAAFPLVGLFAGVWIDRWSRRWTMLAADALRCCALLSLPLAAVLHVLTFAQVVVVAGLAGIGSVFFDVAYGAFVPVLVPPEKLERANARLEATYSAARIGGSGIAGALIGTIGAPLTILVDAASYLASIGTLATIRVPEEHRSAGAREPMFPAIRAGIAVITGSPVLAPLALSIAFQNLGWAVVAAVQLLFFYRTLHLSPALVGVLFAFGNLGFAGALIAPRLSARFGIGRVLLATSAGMALAACLLPLAPLAPVPLIAASELLLAVCGPAFNVVQVSMRQQLVAPELRGRMTATIRALIWGAMPLGALGGAWIASAFGIPAALIAGAALACVSVPFLLVRAIRTVAAPSAPA